MIYLILYGLAAWAGYKLFESKAPAAYAPPGTTGMGEGGVPLGTYSYSEFRALLEKVLSAPTIVSKVDPSALAFLREDSIRIWNTGTTNERVWASNYYYLSGRQLETDGKTPPTIKKSDILKDQPKSVLDGFLMLSEMYADRAVSLEKNATAAAAAAKFVETSRDTMDLAAGVTPALPGAPTTGTPPAPPTGYVSPGGSAMDPYVGPPSFEPSSGYTTPTGTDGGIPSYTPPPGEAAPYGGPPLMVGDIPGLGGSPGGTPFMLAPGLMGSGGQVSAEGYPMDPYTYE